MTVNLRVHKLHPDAKLPEYAHFDDSGMDIFSIEDVTIPSTWADFVSGFSDAGDDFLSKSYAVVNTGLSFEIPQGYEIQIRSKSGLAAKSGIFVLNSPATIDEGYRGELAVILANLSASDYQVKRGQKIAQIVIAPVTKANIILMGDNNESTNRSDKGFGSTGL